MEKDEPVKSLNKSGREKDAKQSAAVNLPDWLRTKDSLPDPWPYSTSECGSEITFSPASMQSILTLAEEQVGYGIDVGHPEFLADFAKDHGCTMREAKDFITKGYFEVGSALDIAMQKAFDQSEQGFSLKQNTRTAMYTLGATNVTEPPKPCR